MKNTREIECKAWVDYPEIIRNKLRELYTYRTSYTKNDTYYRFPGRKESFRIRHQENGTIVTMKKKSRQNGFENNLEIEFSVSDTGNFMRFIGEFHCPVYVKKIKRSEVYTAEGLTVELSHVETLGWFLEIEKLVISKAGEENRDEQRTAREEILAILRDLQISEEKIEERYYTELITGIPEGGE